MIRATVTHIMVDRRAATCELMIACFEQAVREIGRTEARRLWLGVLKQKAGLSGRGKPRRVPVVTATDRPKTGPQRSATTTMNALLVLARTGRRPVGDPPWCLDGGE